MNTSPDRNQRQLALLREIDGFLRAAHIRYWLRGGWALDFHLGAISRQHSDIDLVTWSRHRRRVRALLQARGYRIVRVTEEAAIHAAKRGQDVGIAFIARDDGRIVTPGREFWPWPSDAFEGPPKRLAGLNCRVMSIDALVEEKQHYERHTGRAPRPKDVESIAALRQLLAADRP